jgi:PIN domain nuclease of toxin-antitoxin system
VVETPRNEKYLSIASVWEMSIKHGLGKLKLDLPLRDTIETGVQECGIALLAVDRDHALSVAELPWHHDDPFDRLLIAQARAEDLRIVSRDEAFDNYGVSRIW